MITSTSQTNNDQLEKFCYNNYEENCGTYGGLYQWGEMMQYATTEDLQGICPTGWHIPSDGQMTELITFLGGANLAGGKMKETGTVHWNTPNTGATNEVGYTSLAGGLFSDGTYLFLGQGSTFWSSTQFDNVSAWYRCIYFDDDVIDRFHHFKTKGFGVRCLKD
jgi:uncharacterized protein (TIGR02145 family)